jgi:hypothetical protein
MNDNYLWDRSGEVDAEIQELENVLGTLRYQPRPLEIPANVQVGRRRSLFPALAIAAAIALIVLGLSLWFNFNRRPGQEQAAKPKIENGQQTTVAHQPQNESNDRVAQIHQDENPATLKNREAPTKRFIAVRRTRRKAIEPELTPEEIAAKEQVLTALRLVSVKLNVAQRRTQGAPLPNVIRNQHKIG